MPDPEETKYYFNYGYLEDIHSYQLQEKEDAAIEKKALSLVKRAYKSRKNLKQLEHVLRVAEATKQGRNHDYTTIAILHAVLEDGIMPVSKLEGLFGGYTAEAVESLTRRDKPMREYYRALFKNYYGTNIRIIKIHDLLEHDRRADLIGEAEKYLIPHMRARKNQNVKMYQDYSARMESAIEAIRNP